MAKKNLEKLFQEKLKDFSEVPDEKVWRSIEASLDNKKKSRSVIPIWWKLGGVAAVLLIAIILINPFEDKATNSPVVTEVDDSTEKTPGENKANEVFKDHNSDKDQLVDVEQENIANSDDTSTNEAVDTNTGSKEGPKSHQILKSSKQNQNVLGVQVVKSDKIAVEKTIEKNGTVASENTFDEINREAEVADTGVSKTEVEQNVSKENSEVQDNGLLNEIDKPSKEGVAQNKKEESPKDIEEAKKKSILDAIAEQEQENETIVESTGSKWSAGPSIAPVYFDALGKGSPVHSIFVPNSKSGDVNLSYGLSVAYEVSKKLSVRSGIHKVDYGYRTNDVEFSSSLETATNGQIDNIDYTLTSKSLILSSKVNNTRIGALQDYFTNSASEDISATSAARVGAMEQRFGYLEVPVELNYALIDTRFGIDLIGGISSLFLIDNSISLSWGELTTKVGEANNINSVNFSTNVGFGMNYKFTPKVQLNIEPVFKYQLNTFSKTDGTFNPFSVGVYSGLSFKF